MEGKKYDSDKPRFSLLPEGTMLEIVKVLEHGAKKYGKDNWRSLDNFDERYYNAIMRHLEAWRNGEKIDPDSGLPHLAHIGCSVLFLLSKELKNVTNPSTVSD